MSDHPILFSGPMVRALLAGRKTQTRRVLKSARVFATPERPAFTLRGDDLARALQNASGFRRMDGDGWFWEADAFAWQAPHTRTGWLAHIGYAPGDRLWVRESWQTGSSSAGPQISYRATPDFYAIDAWDGPDYGAGPSFNYDRCPSAHWHHWLADVLDNDGPWRPGIHMPRWASRLTLPVTETRVERLQDISEEDAFAEGVCQFVEGLDKVGWGDLSNDDRRLMVQTAYGSAIKAYSHLWDTINGPGAWDANPWVIATSFTVQAGNIDQVPA